jgi:hypothetical protein
MEATWSPPYFTSELTPAELRIVRSTSSPYIPLSSVLENLRRNPIRQRVFDLLVPDTEEEYEQLRSIKLTSVELQYIGVEPDSTSFPAYRAYIATRALDNVAPWLMRMSRLERIHWSKARGRSDAITLKDNEGVVATGRSGDGIERGGWGYPGGGGLEYFYRGSCPDEVDPEALMAMIMTTRHAEGDPEVFGRPSPHDQPPLLDSCHDDVLMLLISSLPRHPERLFPLLVRIMTGGRVAWKEEFFERVRPLLPALVSPDPVVAWGRILGYYIDMLGFEDDILLLDDALVTDAISVFARYPPSSLALENFALTVIHCSSGHLDQITAFERLLTVGFDPQRDQIDEHANLVEACAYNRYPDLIIWCYQRGYRPNWVTIGSAVVAGTKYDTLTNTDDVLDMLLKLEAAGVPILIEREWADDYELNDPRFERFITDEGKVWLTQNGYLYGDVEEELLVKPAASRVREEHEDD